MSRSLLSACLKAGGGGVLVSEALCGFWMLQFETREVHSVEFEVAFQMMYRRLYFHFCPVMLFSPSVTPASSI